MSVGYLRTPLIKKLGIKDDFTVCVVNAPNDYKKILGILPKGVNYTEGLKSNSQFIQYFSLSEKDLKKNFPKLKKSLSFEGSLWISWLKGSTKVESMLNENLIRDIGLKYGLVDVKVIAVDKIWSGLKFVYRIKDRQKYSSPKKE